MSSLRPSVRPRDGNLTDTPTWGSRGVRVKPTTSSGVSFRIGFDVFTSVPFSSTRIDPRGVTWRPCLTYVSVVITYCRTSLTVNQPYLPSDNETEVHYVSPNIVLRVHGSLGLCPYHCKTFLQLDILYFTLLVTPSNQPTL